MVAVIVPAGVLVRELAQPAGESSQPGSQQPRPNQPEAAGSGPPGPTYPDGKVFGFVIPEDELDTMPQVAEEVLGGRMPDRFTYYKSWAQAEDFDPSVPDQIIEYGMQPLLTWEAMDPLVEPRETQPEYALQTIIDGQHDEYIRRWAQQIKDWGKPLWIRFNHEMNLDIYPWCGACNGNTPEQYIASYRHVHDIFTELGVTNVKWNWSVNAKGPDTVPVDQLYPGDAYVDEIGIDGYNGGTELDWGGWTMFDDLFGPTMADIEAFAPDKLIHITETGSTFQGGDRAAWIRDMFAQVKSNPKLKGFTYFNFDKEGPGEGDWLLEPGNDSTRAFAEELGRLNE